MNPSFQLLSELACSSGPQKQKGAIDFSIAPVYWQQPRLRLAYSFVDEDFRYFRKSLKSYTNNKGFQAICQVVL